jgi:1-deoxy-D-xylulose-5-phosphate reductoisomerase
LDGKCSIIDLAKGIIGAIQKFENIEPNNIEDIYRIDKEVRQFCKNLY